jgi:hypothetical protein
MSCAKCSDSDRQIRSTRSDEEGSKHNPAAERETRHAHGNHPETQEDAYPGHLGLTAEPALHEGSVRNSGPDPNAIERAAGGFDVAVRGPRQGASHRC